MFLLDPNTQQAHYFDEPQPVPEPEPQKPKIESQADDKEIASTVPEPMPVPVPVPQLNGNDQAIVDALANGWSVLTDEEHKAHVLKMAQAMQAKYVPSPEVIKEKRLALLAETDALAMRHVRQSAALTAAQLDARAKAGKAITSAQFKALEAYAQALRDLPETLKSWPAVAAKDWPTKPVFIN